MLLFIPAVFFFLKQEQALYPGEPNNGNSRTSIVTFETEVANFENEFASEKRPLNQNAFIKINDLGVILLGKEFNTYQCTQLFNFLPRFLQIIDRKCCMHSFWATLYSSVNAEITN